MHLHVFETPELLARSAAGNILALVSTKPNAVICIASGDTPRLTNKYVVEGAKQHGIDFSGVQFISLDEWVGVPRSNTGSCYYFLNETIFEPLAIQESNIHFFNATANDLSAECKRINNTIKDLNGIDLIVLGIGVNGHIGFNEPGVSPDLLAHVLDLDPITLQVGQKYFAESATLQKGITLGIRCIMQCKMAILMATGSKKAAIIKKTLEEKVSNAVPASYMQAHNNSLVLLDKEAAALLQ